MVESRSNTYTIDVLNLNVLSLLQDLERLQLIHIRKDKSERKETNIFAKYKGAMQKQTLSDIDAQLKELRNEWE